jgi:hypothetical protein
LADRLTLRPLRAADANADADADAALAIYAYLGVARRLGPARAEPGTP